MLGAGGRSDPLSPPPSTIEGVRGPGLKMKMCSPGQKGPPITVRSPPPSISCSGTSRCCPSFLGGVGVEVELIAVAPVCPAAFHLCVVDASTN